MENPDRPGDRPCPHIVTTAIECSIHKHEHTRNVNRWIQAKRVARPALVTVSPTVR